MNKSRLISLLLCLCLPVSLLTGCGRDPQPAAEAGSSVPAETAGAPLPSGIDAPATGSAPAPEFFAQAQAASRYAAAAAALAASQDLTAEVTVTETRILGEDTVRETTTRVARYQGMGTEDPAVHISESTVSGENRTPWEQLWYGGAVYAKLKQTRFRGLQTLEDFLEGQLPPVLLHPENYGSLTCEGDVWIFSEPLAAEPWAMPEGGTLLEASASAVLTDGAITAADYEITFTLGAHELHTVWHAVYTPFVDRDLRSLVPDDADDSADFGTPEAALLFFRAWQALNGSSCASLETEGSVTYGSRKNVLLFEHTLHNWGRGGDLCYAESSDTVFLNTADAEPDAHGFQMDAASLRFRFVDGIYTENRNGAESSHNIWDAGWNPERYGNDLLQQIHAGEVELLPTYNNLTAAALQDAGDVWRIEFSAGKDYGKRLLQAFSGLLYGDRSRLLAISSDFSFGKAEGWLELEKRTWLPTALSVSFEGVCTVDGEPFPVAMERNTRFRLYDPDTYETITGAPRADAEIPESPTPLFYEVTGENGERLWLLGTIHIGDNRTAALPRVIYDAFDSADALVLELDARDYYAQLKKDAGLQTRLAESRIYTDGTAIADHIDPELYAEAVRLLQEADRYSGAWDRYKPVVWAGSIQKYYWEQGLHLTEPKGVDNRLAYRALSQRKEILEAESRDDHVFLMTELPDAVQEMLLQQIVSMSREAYIAELEAMYELWCEGDEGALRFCVAAINEADRIALGARDPAVYEEYHRRMYTERNAVMLETAEDCLRSGRTVFFAVGLAHLLEDGGLVDALRSDGWTVTQVDTGGAD